MALETVSQIGIAKAYGKFDTGPGCRLGKRVWPDLRDYFLNIRFWPKFRQHTSDLQIFPYPGSLCIFF